MRALNRLILISAVALLGSASASAAIRNTDLGPGGVKDSPQDTGPLSIMRAPTAGLDVLYAPSEADDPALRAAIEAFVDGNVDYWDARAATPAQQDLDGYECVMTWANFSYSDNVAFGDNLAAFVDAGGVAVLGAFTTFTSGNSLAGAIMGPGYSPVTGGNNHFSDSSYAGDGVTELYDGVTSFSSIFRDILTLQGAGVQDGSFEDGEIAAAYQGAVVYANGAGGVQVVSAQQDYPRLIANACNAVADLNTTDARFKVTKTFSDLSTDEVDVTLTCNGGLPLEQTFTIAGGDPAGVTFVVTEIPDSGATCEVTESGGPAGYTTVLNGGSGCTWDDVTVGNFNCRIENIGDDAIFTVVKEWEFEGAGGNLINPVADVTITCDSEIAGGIEVITDVWELSGSLSDGQTLVASVDASDGSATCSASETISESGVEEESSGCGSTLLGPAETHTCTFTNTVFFEGIPTLNQYGMALLAILMLGVGFIGFRRFA